MARQSLPAELKAIDLLLTRWASYGDRGVVIGPLKCTLGRLIEEGPGAGAPTNPNAMPDEILELDGIIIRCHPNTRKFIHVWYAKQDPVTEKARRMGVSRAMVYIHWHSHLRYILGAWTERVSAIETLRTHSQKQGLTKAPFRHQSSVVT